MKLALQLSRRVLLKTVGGVGLTLGCGEGAGELLVDGLGPIQDPSFPYPLDTEGDDEMPRGDEYHQLYDPLFLYARSTVSPGASAGPNVAALVNPHGLPMELLAVRFRLLVNNTASNAFDSITGMGVGVKMDIGDVPLVDAAVPVSAFGSVRDADDLAYGNVITTGQGASSIPQTYTWRLRHPLYVPPGGVVTPVFTHLGQNHFPVIVDMLYICRSLPLNYVPPQQVRVPWVGSYNSVSFDNLADQSATQDLSSELDIVNPFRQPLELSRMVGLVSAVVAGASGGGASGLNVECAMAHRFKYGTLRMRSRSGDEVVGKKTVFNGLFPYGWRAWDIPPGWALAPGEFYKAQLSISATSATAPDSAQLGSIQYSIAATGFRALPLKVYEAAVRGGA